MIKFEDFRNRKKPLKHRLLANMLTLSICILSFVLIGIFLLGNFDSTSKKTYEDLSFQMEVFNRQIDKQFEGLAMNTSSLENYTISTLNDYFETNNIKIDDLNNNPTHLNNINNKLFDYLKTILLKSDCSGAFVMLNATVNTSIEGANNSRNGLYFQRGTLDETDESLLLFRGNSTIGKENNIMTHRKWRLEFNTTLIPNYENVINNISGDIAILPVTKLESTSDHVIQIVKPIYYKNTCYGLCGFEISANYFKTHFSQPTQLKRLTCIFTRTSEDIQNEYLVNEGFSAGILKGYYLAPDSDLKVEKYNSTLYKLTGESSQIGVIRKIKLYDSYFDLVTMIPKNVYDNEVLTNSLRFTILSIMLLFITITCSIFFSRRFVTPIIKALDKIKNQEHIDATSEVSEIDDLFQYLSNQDKLADEEINSLKKELEHYVDMAEKHSKEAMQKQNEVERLAYCRKNEVDPDDYLAFKQGLKTLTKTEKIIFKMYLHGKSAKDIMNELNIQESTIKYHNHNLLEKLNVSTRKQMLRYALILKQEEKDRENKE